MNADTYLAGWFATRRVKDADGYTLADLDSAARFTADNEYVRQAETMVDFRSPDFSQGGGALLVHPNSVDSDAGLRGSIGTADGRVVFTSDTTVTRTVDCILFTLTLTYVVPGTQHVKASTARRNGSKTPRKPDNEVSAAALRMRAYRERQAAKRERERNESSRIAISDARTPLPNLSAELVDC